MTVAASVDAAGKAYRQDSERPSHSARSPAAVEANRVKADFSWQYVQPLPGPYYSAMAAVDYQIPETARPAIEVVISELASRTGSSPLNVLDLGCSYGVLSALIKYGLSLDALFRRYHGGSVLDGRLEADRRWLGSLPGRTDVEFHGIDASVEAIAYARDVGLLRSGVALDLEDDRNREASLAPVPTTIDLIVSTGCVGYIGCKTFASILDHLDPGHRPVILSFVLRAFDYADIDSLLGRHGYLTRRIPNRSFLQRRFSSPTEKSEMLAIMARSGRYESVSLPERDGYCRADLYVSFPEEMGAFPFEGLL